jgi:hypothetical protein
MPRGHAMSEKVSFVETVLFVHLRSDALEASNRP